MQYRTQIRSKSFFAAFAFARENKRKLNKLSNSHSNLADTFRINLSQPRKTQQQQQQQHQLPFDVKFDNSIEHVFYELVKINESSESEIMCSGVKPH
jgi:hypothetical protein